MKKKMSEEILESLKEALEIAKGNGGGRFVVVDTEEVIKEKCEADPEYALAMAKHLRRDERRVRMERRGIVTKKKNRSRF